MNDSLTKEKADYAELTAWFAAWKDRPTKPFLLAPHAHVAYPAHFFDVLASDIASLDAGRQALRGRRAIIKDLGLLRGLFGPK